MHISIGRKYVGYIMNKRYWSPILIFMAHTTTTIVVVAISRRYANPTTMEEMAKSHDGQWLVDTVWHSDQLWLLYDE